MGRDNQPKHRQAKDLRRKHGKRPTYDRILIVSEGSKTEPNYFGEIRQSKRLSTAHVVVVPSELGTAPNQVVAYAKRLLEQGDSTKRIAPGAFEQVFVAFDRDEHLTYHDALAQVEALKGKLRNDNRKPVRFTAIVSVPCFELWLLLHFEDVRSAMHRDEVVRRLKRYLPGYEKGGVGHFVATCEHLEQARQRAQELSRTTTAHDGEASYTNVYLLVDELMGQGQPA
ncbi:MAG: hypothetical protein COX57_00870 [Alphaproteobacteria bacterium CG_4_10_14_0_2_um_filter_63_37]|nr:MAG: hypothetical protein AUJ55_11345 [Proteobacteria bacterium CG1_02_64_396]PJA25873.1 MAG: hypothetical protein COX57_00870 [Alphaproteobacteria bacterium CG_4_10_14_0_2_um_filter_63_37]